MALSCADFIAILQQWPRFALKYWWQEATRTDWGCFGTGYNSWGVQTNQKFVGAMAVLAAASELDEDEAGMAREEILDKALRALRYSLATHITGEHHCSDGTQWGHTWISALGLERMLHGISAIREQLTEADQAALRRVICSEADWLLDYPIQGTLWAKDGGNKPESNIWNGALCCRAALLFPEEPHASDWLEKAHCFFINGISVPADATAETVIAGKPVRERHVGPNFFPHYALDHHGYLNIGYMIICLSNIAMLHYGLMQANLPPPESLYWHARDLWQLVRMLIFDNGRLLRLGGDSRQRYCYCQDYLLPTLFWAADYYGDEEAKQWEEQALELIRQEQTFNGDGSFLSRRLHVIRHKNPYYYTRLEADKAVVLSMNVAWRKLLFSQSASSCAANSAKAVVASSTKPESCAWEELEHGALFVRSRRRFASWAWRAYEPPQGLCLTLQDGHLAEWSENLGGSIRLASDGECKRSVLCYQQQLFPGGFITAGIMADSPKALMAEGWTYPEAIPHRLAVAALPDERALIVLEYCVVPIRTYFREIKGLKLNIANDLFNGFVRRYYTPEGCVLRRGEDKGVWRFPGRWANVDNRLGVICIYGSEEIYLVQAGQRRASGYEASLYYDELCAPYRCGLWDEPPGAVVLDCGNIVLAGTNHPDTARAAADARRLATDGMSVRAVLVLGADGRRYLFVANFNDSGMETKISLPQQMDITIHNVVTGEDIASEGAKLHISVPAAGALLFVLME